MMFMFLDEFILDQSSGTITYIEITDHINYSSHLALYDASEYSRKTTLSNSSHIDSLTCMPHSPSYFAGRQSIHENPECSHCKQERLFLYFLYSNMR